MSSIKSIGIGFAVSLLLTGCGQQQANAVLEQSEVIISKHTVRFTQPPERIPSRNSVDAPLLGNGFTAVALAGSPEAQTFYVARNDFWRLKSALDESYPLVLGKIELSMPSLQGASYLVEQQLYDATSTARFTKEDMAVSYKAYVSAVEDLLVVELNMEGEGRVAGKVSLSLPGEKEIINNPPLERVFPDERESDITREGTFYLWRAFMDSVDIPTKAAMALRMEQSSEQSSSGSFVLEPGKPVRLVCAFSSNFKSDDCVADVIERVTDCSSSRLKEVKKKHAGWWKNYWNKSFVSIPDSVIEKQYYLSLYGMASCSHDLDFPPSIFGSWITRERPNWNGDYHLNYNHMAPYYGLYSSNRIEQADPCYMPLLAQISRGNYYSEKITGIPEGILLPVGAGPLGIETTRRSPFMDTYFKGWFDEKLVEDEGFFMGQKSNSSYAVVNMSMQFYHTWDKSFTEKVYPFVKGVATFWENYLTFEGGRYVIYNDAIHEGTVGTKNPILSLGLVRMVMQTANDMSVLLQTDADRREQWKHVLDNLSEYPLQERNGKTVFRYTETGTDWWGDNTLGIQHIYPAGQIGLNSDPELLKVAHNTLQEMQRWLDFNGSNSFFPAAVRIGYEPDSILHHLARYSQYTYPNGFQLNNPHGIENLSTVPNTINEMLCMGHQDLLRVFPVWPRDKEALFSQLRAEGAFLVSSELKAGIVTYISVFSEQGRPLNLVNPWKGKKVILETDGTDKKVFEGDIIRIETEQGKTYRFVPT